METKKTFTNNAHLTRTANRIEKRLRDAFSNGFVTIEKETKDYDSDGSRRISLYVSLKGTGYADYLPYNLLERVSEIMKHYGHYEGVMWGVVLKDNIPTTEIWLWNF